MLKFNVSGEIYEIDEQFVSLSPYLSSLTSKKFNSDKDEQGRYKLDFDTYAFHNYVLYLEGDEFDMDEDVVELFNFMGINNEYDYPLDYWKNKLLDDHIKDNWKIFSSYRINLESFDAKREFKLDKSLGDYYIVGDFALYLAGINTGFRNIHFISNINEDIKVKFPDTAVYNVNMRKGYNRNKSPFTSRPKIIQEQLNSRRLEELCYSGVCDADMLVYSSKDKKIYCTRRALNAINKREVWMEPDKIRNTKHADRLVALKSQGFNVKLPYRSKIIINGVDNETEPNIIEELNSANEGGDDDIDNDTVYNSADNSLEIYNGILYFNSLGFTGYRIIKTSPIDRLIALESGLIFRESDEYMRDIEYMRKNDEDISDLYLECRYIDSKSILGEMTMIEYCYNKHINSREWFTPDDFGFKKYPELYRNIVYLNNIDGDELINLGPIKEPIMIDKGYISAGPAVFYDYLGLNVFQYNMYKIIFSLTDDNSEYYSGYDMRNSIDDMLERPYKPVYITLHANKSKSLRDAVKYSKVDLEQVAYNPEDSCVYCSLLFLYAFYNKVHTMTYDSRYNVMSRVEGCYGQYIEFFEPNPRPIDKDIIAVNVYFDAVLMLSLYEGELNLKDRGGVAEQDEIELREEYIGYLSEELRDRTRERLEALSRYGISLYMLPKHIGRAMKYISYKDYNTSEILDAISNVGSYFIYPYDYYGTVGLSNVLREAQ